METKKCFKCKNDLPVDSFYRHPRMADGRVNKCKECNKKDVRENYRANVAHYKEYDKERALLPHRVSARKAYSATENGRAAGRRCSKAWEDSNPIKKGASTLVGNAVRDGKITKKRSCEECGSAPSYIHGHHDDYAYPLDVRWLCPSCHRQWHTDNGPGLNG